MLRHSALSSGRLLVILIGFGLVAAGGGGPALADGFIVIENPVEPAVITSSRRIVPRHIYMPLHVKQHHVDVAINDTVAVTKIDQVFTNPNNQQMEGTYIFPLADDVAVQRFSMFMNGEEVQGEVLDKDKAAEIYEGIVRKMKDPALLEYMGSRMYRARVFPIPAKGDVRIKLDYSQVIPVTTGLATYRYPLNTEKFSSAPLNDLAVRVKIKSQTELTSVFCPSHNASVDRQGKFAAVVGYEGKNVLPDKDFIVGYQMSDDEIGLALLSYRESSDAGYFMARIAPAFESDEGRSLPKDICFVIDTSGSMSGKKIEQAREALRFCLDNLNSEDRFNIIAFSTESRPYKDALVSASREQVNAARAYAAELKALGGTNIHDALLAALESKKSRDASDKRPYMIVFLTDGLPTIGETNVETILKDVKKANPGSVRLFAFGVGHDVNTKLLDTLAEENHGARQYVEEQEDLEVKLSAFYTMIAHPVLSDVKISFSGVEATEVLPQVMPDLFKGTELVLFGRYGEPGHHAVVLTGQRGDKKVTLSWEKDFAAKDTEHAYLARLWASRRIGFLLDQIRLNGESTELKEEVVRLAKLHGILTPYTSFLVVEDDKERRIAGRRLDAPAASNVLGLSFGDEAAAESRTRLFSSSGSGAVDASKKVGRLRFNEQAAADLDGEVQHFLRDPAAPSGDGGSGGYGGGGAGGGQGVKADQRALLTVGSRTFYRNGETWIDSLVKEDAEKTKIELFSDAYFQLLAEHPEAGPYLALGQRVVFVLDDRAYEIVQ